MLSFTLIQLTEHPLRLLGLKRIQLIHLHKRFLIIYLVLLQIPSYAAIHFIKQFCVILKILDHPPRSAYTSFSLSVFPWRCLLVFDNVNCMVALRSDREVEMHYKIISSIN